MKIEDREVGPNEPPIIIAEVGINHEGNVDKAKKMVRDAAESGAECVKFQMHVLESEMIDEDVKPGNSDESVREIMERCSLSRSEHEELKELTEDLGMIYLCTPFSRAAADILADMEVDAFKIGSGECNNYPLIRHISSFGKPVILSTGMNDLESIDVSVNILKEAGVEYALLQCTSMYPTPDEYVNLGAMEQLRDSFSAEAVGLSDHSEGIQISLGAIGKGADIIEKHFISNKNWPGPDVPVSINPTELEELITGSERIHKALGGGKKVLDGEESTIKFAYASVVATTEIEEGDKLSKSNTWVKRPGTGEIQADEYHKVVGSHANQEISEGTQLKWDMIDDG